MTIIGNPVFPVNLLRESVSKKKLYQIEVWRVFINVKNKKDNDCFGASTFCSVNDSCGSKCK